MTRRTNARLAGFMFLFYIATGVAGMVLFGRTTRGAEWPAATLASIAQHATTVRLTVVLTLLTFVDAVVLAVALYALTRDQDRWFIWLPMIVFEVVLGLWLLIKGGGSAGSGASVPV